MARTPRGTSRRDFMKAAALAGITAPTIIPRSALGDGEQSPANDRITLGFIGMGRMNRGHLGHFLGQGDVQALAVCDVDTIRREHARKTVNDRYGNQDCGAYNNYRDLLARDDIDAVVISTPDHWHAIPVVEACRAGKDIYCEKPLSLTILEAKRMMEAVRLHACVFQTGSQQRSGREFWLACSLVRSGRIGRVHTVNVNVGGPSQWCDLPAEEMEPGLDWDLWLGPAPERPYHSTLSPRGVHDHFPAWRSYREYSGGSMTDWGAHHFDIAQWGLGMDESGPLEVLPPEDPQVGRGVRFRYANGVEVVHGPGGGVNFVGADGEITVNRGKLESDPPEIVAEPLGDHDVVLERSPGHQRDWLNCIRDRKRPICDVEIGARSVTVCHLGNLGYWYGRPLRWDPARWEFIDDDEANSWRDCERRDPWQLPLLG